MRKLKYSRLCEAYKIYYETTSWGCEQPTLGGLTQSLSTRPSAEANPSF